MVTPLTERILNRLGPPRPLWMLLWAAILGTEYVTAHLAGSPVYAGLEYSLVSVYVLLLALWGIGVVARRVNALQPDLERLLGPAGMRELRPFAGLSSVWGPLVLTLITSSVWYSELIRYPTMLTVVLTPLSLIGWIPANVAIWTIGVILLDLHRLGRRPLQMAPFEEDLSLGLRPLGGLAVTAYGIVSAGVVPLLIAGEVDLSAFLAVFAQYILITLLFAVSLWRLHAQMVDTKAGHVTETRTVYADALRQARTAWSQDRTNHQAAAWVTAAEAIERRAGAIHEWPFAEGMIGQIAGIFSAVVAGILAGAILKAVGL